MIDVPTLSVLMPVYNAEQYIKAAVDSILNQTFSDFEFIIINDGSTDGSLTLLQDYAEKDDRIRLISRENKGLVETLNEGLRLAKAPLIARMDADDISMPNRFEKQVDYLSKNLNCLLLGSRVKIIDEDDDELCEMGDYYSSEELDAGLLAGKGQLIYHPSIIVRKSVVDLLGGYRDTYPQVEDLDLFLRISEVGEIQNLREPLLKYREHLTKIGHTAQLKQQKQIHQLLLEAVERRGLTPQYIIFHPLNKISEFDRKLMWGWWALGAGNVRTARKYALKVFLTRSLSIRTWRFIICAVRGR